jgi:hypothetical protein
MDYRQKVSDIMSNNDTKKYRIEMLEELAYDCTQLMEAEDQNMQPSSRQKVSEGLRLAKDNIRKLSD